MNNYPHTLDAIAQIKGSGFWSSASEKRIKALAKKLLTHGCTDELVAETLVAFWSVARTEYGE